jgi:BMFP domain-containing protein YqiC
MMDPHHDRDFAARTNRDELARLRARVAELEAALRFMQSCFVLGCGPDGKRIALEKAQAALAQGQGE